MLMVIILLQTALVILGEVSLAIRDGEFDMKILISAILFTVVLGTFATVYCYYFEEDFPAISSVIDTDSTEVHKINDKVEYVILKDKAGNTYKLEAAPQN